MTKNTEFGTSSLSHSQLHSAVLATKNQMLLQMRPHVSMATPDSHNKMTVPFENHDFIGLHGFNSFHTGLFFPNSFILFDSSAELDSFFCILGVMVKIITKSLLDKLTCRSCQQNKPLSPVKPDEVQPFQRKLADFTHLWHSSIQMRISPNVHQEPAQRCERCEKKHFHLLIETKLWF